MSQANPQAPLNKPNDVSVKDLILKTLEWWKYILSQWKLIAIVVVIGAGLGLTYACIKKPVYKAYLSFALEDNKSGGGLSAAAGLASQFGIDIGDGGGGAFTGDNLLELMKSRTMVQKTLLTAVNINGHTETLAELYIEFNNLRPKWENTAIANINFLPNANWQAFSLQQDSVLNEIYKSVINDNLTVDKVDKKLSIITINVNSKNELFSKHFVEILAKTVSDFYIDTKTKKSVKNVEILQHQTDSVRAELNAAISGVASSIDAVPNQNPSRQILRTPSQRRQVDAQADQAILTELVKNLEISKISLRKETPLIQIIDAPILPLEKERLSKIKSTILGGFLAGFLIVAIKIVSKLLKNILSDNE